MGERYIRRLCACIRHLCGCTRLLRACARQQPEVRERYKFESRRNHRVSFYWRFRKFRVWFPTIHLTPEISIRNCSASRRLLPAAAYSLATPAHSKQGRSVNVWRIQHFPNSHLPPVSSRSPGPQRKYELLDPHMCAQRAVCTPTSVL